MIVSWNWLQTYVPLTCSPDELAMRLMMAGLNHESTVAAGDDWAIDLEVTSNRPDCLGHIGVAREAAVLFDLPLNVPPATVKEAGPSIGSITKVTVRCSELCPRYTARVIRGVKVGPSPAWMVKRLAAIGIASINNIVDITNYVLMECGQPLHAFDLAKLAGPEIIVRTAAKGEKLEAINHHAYELDVAMCVIADARVPVALGGVMGGAATEVSSATRDLLIEAAEFSPMSIRATARKLNLHSDSSYRFERGVDPSGVDWASRRCCELILELAGGELAQGAIDSAAAVEPRKPVTLRLGQLKRILGIDVDADVTRRILAALGCVEKSADRDRVVVVPPTWRRDLTREIDLVEEVARINGYDKIPEDVPVAMTASTRSPHDRVADKARRVLTAAGFDEALTPSAVSEEFSAPYSPWTDNPPLRCSVPVLRRADLLRRSLVPSLLEAWRTNEALGNERIELFETARVYLSQGDRLPREELMLCLASGRSFVDVKGALEAVAAAVYPAVEVASEDYEHPLFDTAACRLLLDGEAWGFLGELSAAGLAQFDLRGRATVAEVRFDRLLEIARLVPKYVAVPAYPAIDRDLNFVVDESVRWSELAATVRAAAGEHLERIEYRETYRNAKDPQLGKTRKSLLLALRLRSRRGTLTGEEADAIREQIVAACRNKHAAELRA
ncbi:MAG: phenylalanine--tRNA ligase subunit beta [Pirellulales bacterium]